MTFGTGFSLEEIDLDLSYLLSSSSVISPLENTLRFSFLEERQGFDIAMV